MDESKNNGYDLDFGNFESESSSDDRADWSSQIHPH